MTTHKSVLEILNGKDLDGKELSPQEKVVLTILDGKILSVPEIVEAIKNSSDESQKTLFESPYPMLGLYPVIGGLFSKSLLAGSSRDDLPVETDCYRLSHYVEPCDYLQHPPNPSN